jgi:hypothetical protein
VRPGSSSLPAYLLTGGEWLDGQPLFVNRDFDFGMAMTLPDIGPAIAAGTRLKGNRDTAAALADMPALDLSSRLARSLAERQRDDRIPEKIAGFGGEIRLYGVLYGHPQASVWSLLEVSKQTESMSVERVMIVSAKQDLAAYWLADRGAAIQTWLTGSVEPLIELWARAEDSVAQEPERDFRAPAAAGLNKGRGRVLTSDARHVLVRLSDIEGTVARFPAEGFETTEIMPEPEGPPTNP